MESRLSSSFQRKVYSCIDPEKYPEIDHTIGHERAENYKGIDVRGMNTNFLKIDMRKKTLTRMGVTIGSNKSEFGCYPAKRSLLP
jgi:hypothetical protein